MTEQNDKLLAIRKDVLNIKAQHGLAPYARMPANDYFALVEREPQLAAALRIQATFVIYHHGELKLAVAKAAALEDRLRDHIGKTS